MIISKSSVRIHAILKWTLLAFVFTISFPIEVNRVFLAMIYGLAFLNAVYFDKGSAIFHRRTTDVMGKLLPVAYFLLIAFSCLYSSNNYEAYKMVDKHLPLILLPLFWPYFDERGIIDREWIQTAFVYGVLASSLVLLSAALLKSIELRNGVLSFDSRILKDDRIDFSGSITWGGNYFFSTGLSMFIHPTYLTMYLTLAVFFIFESGRTIFGMKSASYASVLLCIVMILLLSSRAGIAVFIAAGVYYWFYKKRGLLTWKSTVVFVAILVGVLLMVFAHPRVRDLVEKVSTTGFRIDPAGSYSYETRLLTWSSGIALIKENALLGVGAGDTEDVLLDFYKKNGYTACYERQYNVHNQYLETWLAAGFFGLLLLIVMLSNFLVVYHRRRDILAVLFIGVIMVNGLFESVFDRYSGVVFFVFFYCLFQTNFSTSKSVAHEAQQ